MSIFKPLACGFHSHTDIGSLDGGSTVERKIKYANKIGRIADCVTDHGFMHALARHWEFAEKCKKDKENPFHIKSIHGIELYMVDPDRPWKENRSKKMEPQYYHVTVHFKTQKAYQYFCSLSKAMNERKVVRYGEAKPLILWEELLQISGEITVGSSCLVGPVQKNILAGRSDLAKKWYEKLRHLAGNGNFFVELFPHIIDKQWESPVTAKTMVSKIKKQIKEASQAGQSTELLEKELERLSHIKERQIIIPGEFVPAIQRMDEDAIDPPFIDECGSGLIDIQKKPNEFVLEMARRHNDPVIISLDDHYAAKSDQIIQNARLSNGGSSWKFYGLYDMKTSEDCAIALKKQLGLVDSDIEKFIDNSYLFVEQFKDYKFQTIKDGILLPTTDMVYGNLYTGMSTKDIFRSLVVKHKRWKPEWGQEYIDRIRYELDVLTNNGKGDFLPYFFVVEDAVAFCKQHDKLFNVRGSAGGSLALYLLGASVTDPIAWNLPFERFMTKERIAEGAMMDADCDVEERDFVLNYLKNKYKENFALISTDLNLKFKSAIKDVHRDLIGVVPPEIEEMCVMMPAAPQGMSDTDFLFGYVDKTTKTYMPGFLEKESIGATIFKQWIEEHPDRWEVVKTCLGVNRAHGVHAGGVLLTPNPVTNYIPCSYDDGMPIASYTMKGVEYVGGVKYDFLGVSTLLALGITMRSIKKHLGIELKWEEFPHDPEVFAKVLHNNKLTSIFQLHTRLVRPFVVKTLPKSVRDISGLIALVRPGALDAASPDPSFNGNAADFYCAVAKGEKQPYYIHPDLEPIFGETNGICLYQEQLLRCFRDLAGYSYGEAEAVRRAVGKKVKELMDLHLGILKSRLLERGWSNSQATDLCETLVKSARYSFNKAHSASYAIVGYNGAWLKHHYPLHFWLGEFAVNTDKREKLRILMMEARHLVLPVNIKHSHVSEWTIEGDKLRPPLSLLKGCGEKTAISIKNAVLGIFGEGSGDIDIDEHEEYDHASDVEGEQYGDK